MINKYRKELQDIITFLQSMEEDTRSETSFNIRMKKEHLQRFLKDNN